MGWLFTRCQAFVLLLIQIQLVVIVAMHFRRPLSRKATAIDSLGRKSQVLGFWRMQVAGRRQERAVALGWINADHATISCTWRPRPTRVVALRLGGLRVALTWDSRPRLSPVIALRLGGFSSHKAQQSTGQACGIRAALATFTHAKMRSRIPHH